MKLKEMIERVQQHHPTMGQVEIIRYLIILKKNIW